MNIAVILAGGIGSRVGAGIPKQFIEILGKPVLAYTLEAFENHPDIHAILVVCVADYLDSVWEMKETYGFSKLRWVTQGGDSFQASVKNGVDFLHDKAERDDTVLFHFGASPFVTADIITDVIRVCRQKGNAISTTDFYLLSGKKKTVSSVRDPENYTDEYINRDTVAVMNTPHAFQYGFIDELYREAAETGVLQTVEPHTTSLMYALGKPIYFAKGSQTNIKITTREDLGLFEGYVLKKKLSGPSELSGDVVVFLAEGFEECEALMVVDLLRRAGLKVVMASITGNRQVLSSRSIPVTADCLAENVLYGNAKMLVLPGGRRGTENLAASALVREKCLEFAKDKYVAAICAAPTILAELGLLDGKKATVHPDFVSKMGEARVKDKAVVRDGNLITGQGLGAAIPFALKLVKLLAGKDTARKIRHAICCRTS